MKVRLILIFSFFFLSGAHSYAQDEPGVVSRPVREDAKILKKARSSDWQGVNWALQLGGNANSTTISGVSLLHISAANGQVELSEKLLRYGANPDAQDSSGRTPLMYAVMEGHEFMALVLACSGSDLSVADADGKSAFQLAEASHDFSTMSILNEAACNPEVVDAYQRMGQARQLAEENGLAESIELQSAACSQMETALGKGHFKVGVCKNNLASIYQAGGLFDDAKTQFLEALDIVETAAGTPSPTSGWIRNNLGRLQHSRLLLTEAEQWLRESLAVFDAFGTDRASERVSVMSNLGMVLSDLGRKDEAESMYVDAWNFGEANGVQRTLIATILNNIATLYLGRGDLTAAGNWYQQALYEYAILIQRDGLIPYLVNYATIVMNFSTVLQSRSDFEGAALRMNEVLKMLEDAAPGQPILALAYSNRALLHLLQGEPEQADTLFTPALQIYREKLGPDHPETALVWMNLGFSAFQQEKYTEARENFLKALAVYERLDAAGLQARALIKANLAETALTVSDFVEAESWFDEAESEYRELQQEANPAHFHLLLNRSRMLWLRDEQITQDVLDLTSRASEELVAFTDTILPSLSFSEQLAFLEGQISGPMGYMFSVAKDSKSLRDFYSKIIRWKGRLAQNLRTSREFRQLDGNPEYEIILTGLSDLRAQQADWYRKSGSIPAERWKVSNDSLNAVKEFYERALRSDLGSAVGEDPLFVAGWDGFQDAFREEEAMVDVYLYTSYRDGVVADDRYVGVLTGSEIEPVAIDLGSTDEVEAVIQHWLDGVGRMDSMDENWEKLEKIVWDKIAVELPATVKRLWISPDAMLSRIPWHLFLATESPLVVGIVDSPREWLRMRTAIRDTSNTQETLLLVGDVDFDSGSGKTNPSSGRFSSLPGTAAEVDAINAIAPDARIETVVLKRDQGSRERVSDQMETANWIHLATHGFFYQAKDTGSIDSRSERLLSGGLSESNQTYRNPLVESGLALAGANVETVNAKTGLLTAEELIGLDLTNAELVVLSACDTGRGSEITGQGVMGLRASIMAAGARSLLMSLWKVPDASTALLMEAFYTNLWKRNMSKIDALRAAQAEVRSRYPAPIYWAAWVLAGDPE